MQYLLQYFFEYCSRIAILFAKKYWLGIGNAFLQYCNTAILQYKLQYFFSVLWFKMSSWQIVPNASCINKKVRQVLTIWFYSFLKLLKWRQEINIRFSFSRGIVLVRDLGIRFLCSLVIRSIGTRFLCSLVIKLYNVG